MVTEKLGPEPLLERHGQIIDQEDGYWIQIEAWRVNATSDIPLTPV